MYSHMQSHVLTRNHNHMNCICVHLKGSIDHSESEGVEARGEVYHVEDGEGGVNQGGLVKMAVRRQLPQIVHHTLHMQTKTYMHVLCPAHGTYMHVATPSTCDAHACGHPLHM